ncbi:MAG: hypothetical protein WBC44_21665 [Planctomycetaceae bacterium]
MKTLGRRLHFQLMPLLDLLLIMIFALYLEVRVREETQADQAESRIAASEQQLEAERARLAAERERLAAESIEIQRRLNDVVEQQRHAANLVGELFDVPQELVDEALKPLPAGAPPRTPQEAERLRERFAQLAALRGPEVIEHLFSYDELRKRADVWTLRIRANGEIAFSNGQQTQLFRADAPAEFASRLFDRYKTLAQPKGLVVLLVSYGDARADVRQAVLDGLPEAVRLMRDDQLGRTQFEYAVLGYIDTGEQKP